jgi:hypothetical protein
MSGRDRPSTTGLWPTMGDARKPRLARRQTGAPAFALISLTRPAPISLLAIFCAAATFRFGAATSGMRFGCLPDSHLD